MKVHFLYASRYGLFIPRNLKKSDVKVANIFDNDDDDDDAPNQVRHYKSFEIHNLASIINPNTSLHV